MKRFLLYLSYIVLVPLDWITSILTIILAPIAIMFIDSYGELPFFLRWMGTFDNELDGDSGHVKRWEEIISKYNIPIVLGIYLQRVAWLMRNKAYNFAYYVLGREAISSFKWKGNPNVDSQSSNKETQGWLLMWNASAWGLFGFVPWLKISNRQFYLRVYLGWKLKSEVSDENRIGRAMLAFHINPFRNFVINT